MGFADFPFIAYHFERLSVAPAAFIPIFDEDVCPIAALVLSHNLASQEKKRKGRLEGKKEDVS